jgi:hypothetical protein
VAISHRRQDVQRRSGRSSPTLQSARRIYGRQTVRGASGETEKSMSNAPLRRAFMGLYSCELLRLVPLVLSAPTLCGTGPESS